MDQAEYRGPSAPPTDNGLAAHEAGRVLGTRDSQPLDFWVAVEEGGYLQLDDVVAVETELPEPLPDGRRTVMHYGVVDEVRSAYEGATFHSDVFRVTQGLLPVGLSTVAHVAVTRVEPEVFIPPRPGQAVRRAEREDREQALYFDHMAQRFPVGLSRDGKPVYGNLEFLNGTRGAHVNISGISGVATKTTYALFLLYGLFHSRVLPNAHATHAIVFNVKGEDLLYLDQRNAKLDELPDERRKYQVLDLPVGPFQSVGLWAPSKPGDISIPDTGGRWEGVTPYYWTLREFCRDRLLRFLFTESDDETSQLSSVISQVERYLGTVADIQLADRPELAVEDPPGGSERTTVRNLHSLEDLATFLMDNLGNERIYGRQTAPGTQQAFARRLEAAVPSVAGLIRAERESEAQSHRFDWTHKQVSVIDINRLSDRGKRFVVGVVVRRLMQDKERQGRREPLVFLVLDELNKYAPRDGHSPIKEVVLDISERGRSLGVILMGAQQTASEIERRVTANASFRVVGRLDTAEGQRDEYGFLTSQARARSAILKPGSMFVHQPDVPVPLLVQFPFPSWATRADETPAQREPEEPALFRRASRGE